MSISSGPPPLQPNSLATDINVTFHDAKDGDQGSVIVTHAGRSYQITDYTHVDLKGRQTNIALLNTEQKAIATEIIKAMFAPQKMQDALKGLADHTEGTFNVDADEKVEKATLNNAKVGVTGLEFKEMRERIDRAWGKAHPSSAAAAAPAANASALVNAPKAHALVDIDDAHPVIVSAPVVTPPPAAAATAAAPLTDPNAAPNKAGPAQQSKTSAAAIPPKKTMTPEEADAAFAKLKAQTDAIKKEKTDAIDKTKENGKATAAGRKDMRAAQAQAEVENSNEEIGLANFSEVASADKTSDLGHEILRAQFTAHLTGMEFLHDPSVSSNSSAVIKESASLSPSAQTKVESGSVKSPPTSMGEISQAIQTLLSDINAKLQPAKDGKSTLQHNLNDLMTGLEQLSTLEAQLKKLQGEPASKEEATKQLGFIQDIRKQVSEKLELKGVQTFSKNQFLGIASSENAVGKDVPLEVARQLFAQGFVNLLSNEGAEKNADAKKMYTILKEYFPAQFETLAKENSFIKKLGESFDAQLTEKSAAAPAASAPKPAAVATPAPQKSAPEAVAPVSSEPSSKLGAPTITIKPLPASPAVITGQSLKLFGEFKQLQNDFMRAQRNQKEQATILDEMLRKLDGFNKFESRVPEGEKAEYAKQKKELKDFVKSSLGMNDREVNNQTYLLNLKAEDMQKPSYFASFFVPAPKITNEDLSAVVLKKAHIRQIVLGEENEYDRMKSKLAIGFSDFLKRINE